MAKKKRKVQSVRSKANYSYAVCSPEATAKMREREAFAARVFSEAKTLKKNNEQHKQFFDFMDMDGIRVRRRIGAAVATADQVQNRVSPFCPEISDVFSFDEHWFTWNAYAPPPFDILNYSYNFGFAAAIWILDQLRLYDRIPEAIAFFPTDFETLENLVVPYVWDICHADDILCAATYVIEQRNVDCVGKKETAGNKKHKIKRVFMDWITAENKQKQDVPSRRNFEGVINLIPQGAIDIAVSYFEEKFWDMIDRYYRSIGIIIKEKADLLKMEDRNDFGFGGARVGVSVNKSSLLKPDFNNKNLLNLPKGTSLPSIIIDSNSTSKNDNTERTEQLSPFNLEVSSRLSKANLLESVDMKFDDFEHSLPLLGLTSMDTFREQFGDEIYSIWEDFTIEDPYMISFAFLYLLDNNSDLPWLYAPCTNLMTFSSNSFPWVGTSQWRDFGKECEDSEETVDNKEHHQVISDEQLISPMDIRYDWFNKNYQNHCVPEDFIFKRANLAQIVFRATGCLVPRYFQSYVPDRAFFEEYGITDDKVISDLCSCISYLNMGKHQSFLRTDIEADNQDEDDNEDAHNGVDVDLNVETLQAKVAALQSEVAHLKKFSHEVMREMREEKKRYEYLEKKAAYNRLELVDLRELVFNQQQTVPINESVDDKITFPYHTQKRLVVFGGHDSWAREIKPKLPDVRFIDRTMLPNSDMIRRADEVWIQSNAISHAYFYKIIDEVRKYDIPVRYFTFASAVKCAEQIVKSDLESF